MPAPARKPGPAVGDDKNYCSSNLCCAASVRPGSGQVHEHTTLGSRPAPGTLSAKRSVGTRRAASMQDTLPEGTARAAQQLAPSASPPASAVGRSTTRSVVADSVRRRAAPLRRAFARAPRRVRCFPSNERPASNLQVLPETGCTVLRTIDVSRGVFHS
jgi:hypothetical protein